MLWISSEISFVDCADFSASLRTSSATTAKLRPCSPARAASIAAFKASRLVCSAKSSITSMILPMSSARWPRTSMISPDERIVLLILFSPSVAFSIVLIPLCTSSREEVHSGINTMEKATEGLNKINSTIRSSGEIIDVLGQRADDIGKIIEVIDDLAEQTNLLALNAAIEAARAGEHGLGFAVVADEVRKLAEKSAQSTKEISELIQSIQKEARKAVENMERSTGIVNDGLGLGQELNAALRKISNVVTEVYKFAQEIGAATNEQSVGSSQIAKATSRLTEITQEINSAVEEIGRA